MKQTRPFKHEVRRLSAAVIASLAAASAQFSSAQAAGTGGAAPNVPGASANAAAHHPYVGMWVTDDGRVRHELLPNGRYDEARGNRESAYQGRYEVQGNHIEYWDDTGFTADGDFVDADTLHHGGMILRRQR